ncbi:MAG TPA: hypothetical protein VK721_08045 [Solirubrobacteraceae bacterium]|nr:hypothetical protein [Solirubrobacteraceae bacterium]
MLSPLKMCALAGSSSLVRVMSGVASLAVLAVSVALTGCGTTHADTPTAVLADAQPRSSSEPKSCPAAVLATRASVVERVYHEGVHSERVDSAEYLIEHSAGLRAAVEGANRPAARAAIQALLATGHLTDLAITRAGKPFIAVGTPALAPVQGTLTGARGTAIASYVTSVWADNGFLSESRGISQGVIVLRTAKGTSVGGSPSLGSHSLPNEGTLMLKGVAYSYTSFPAQAYPSGALRVYLLIPTSATSPLCGRTTQDTTVNTLRRVAELIYSGETAGRATRAQVRRVQSSRPLLEAVARREPAGTERAIHALLNHHIVRLRVSAGGQLLSDVGGPYVLGPVSAPLRFGGHTIGSFVLSIQDDEGYLRLTRRLAGLDVLMYMNLGSGPPQLVKDSLGPMPGPALASVPASGAYRYRGRSFRVFTVHAAAFPSGPLTIRVLVPIPYPGA